MSWWYWLHHLVFAMLLCHDLVGPLLVDDWANIFLVHATIHLVRASILELVSFVKSKSVRVPLPDVAVLLWLLNHSLMR